MKPNSAFAGFFLENSFNYQQFHLRELRTIRDGKAIFSLDTISPGQSYVQKLGHSSLTKIFHLYLWNKFLNHYVPVFELNSLQDAVE